MFKKIRDFVYDISDIFITLIIIFAAAGIIMWRAGSLVDYPQYIDEHPQLKSSIELVVRQQEEKRAETAARRAKEASRGIIKATINIESGFDGGWDTVAERLISAKIIKEDEKEAFVEKAEELDLGEKPAVGIFALSSDMTYSQIIRILCGI